MRLGIFGDSFAACAYDEIGYSWPKLLYNEEDIHGQVSREWKETDCYALTGTSAFWSYTNFLERRHLYDHVIFLTTFYNRWPLLPKEMEQSSWNVHSHDVRGFSDQLKYMNKFYYDIFNMELLKLINHSIFRNVNEICKKENKYLINIICFDKDDYDFSLTNFPVFYNLNEVSSGEKIVENNIPLTMRQYVNERQNSDYRQCHLGHTNNLILKNILLDCLRNKKMNLKIDLYNTNYCWAGYDRSLYEIFRLRQP